MTEPVANLSCRQLALHDAVGIAVEHHFILSIAYPYIIGIDQHVGDRLIMAQIASRDVGLIDLALVFLKFMNIRHSRKQKIDRAGAQDAGQSRRQT